jgi:hypothetical protein
LHDEDGFPNLGSLPSSQNKGAKMKDICATALNRLRSARTLLIAGVAAALLAACYRTDPTPDPPPAPPDPQLPMHGPDDIQPGIYPAIFIYPASEVPALWAENDIRIVT